MNNQVQLYNQKGGVAMLIATIGQTIMVIGATVISGLGKGLVDLFKIAPADGWRKGDYTDFRNYFVGGLWKFLWFSVKSSLYLLIFCFGGPILMIIGIIYLYKNLFNKLQYRSDYQEEKAKNEQAKSESNNGS